MVEATGCLRAVECAANIASLDCASLEGVEQGSANAAKSRILRDIVEGDFPFVSNRTHAKDIATLDSH
jgi:hypothetical protein